MYWQIKLLQVSAFKLVASYLALKTSLLVETQSLQPCLQPPVLIGAQDTWWTSWLFYLFSPAKPLSIFNKLFSPLCLWMIINTDPSKPLHTHTHTDIKCAIALLLLNEVIEWSIETRHCVHVVNNSRVKQAAWAFRINIAHHLKSDRHLISLL